MERMKKRVYGIIGLSSLMSNWNADFTGNPKSTLDGRIFGSDKALKYSFRRLWNDQGKKVLYFKTLKKDNLQPMELEEKYEELFGEGEKSGSKKAKGDKELIVLSNLFNTVDGKQFGITFPSKKYGQFSVTGAVQIKQGFNFYKNTVNIQDVLSPFKNSNNKDADNSSIGKMIFTDETHYFYPFIINPLAYKEYEKLGLTNGYTEEDYKLFKETALKSVTALNSASKFGCSNEFALFIETDEFLDMPVIDRFFSYEKRTNESKAKIKFKLNSVLELYKKDIKKVEVYYNPDFIEFETDLENIETFIF